MESPHISPALSLCPPSAGLADSVSQRQYKNLALRIYKVVVTFMEAFHTYSGVFETWLFSYRKLGLRKHKKHPVWVLHRNTQLGHSVVLQLRIKLGIHSGFLIYVAYPISASFSFNDLHIWIFWRCIQLQGFSCIFKLWLSVASLQLGPYWGTA